MQELPKLEIASLDQTKPTEDNQDEPWNYKLKLLLKNIGEKSMGYRWMHAQDSVYYELMDKYYGIFGLILSATITTITSGSIISIYAQSSYGNNVMQILNIVNLILSLILSITIGIKEFNDYKATHLSHKQMSYKFAQIYHSIQEQFALPLEHRAADVVFLRHKIKEYDDLMESPLNIRKKTLHAYMHATNNNDIYKPIIVGNFEKIDIEDANAKDGEIKPNANMNYEIERWLKNF